MKSYEQLVSACKLEESRQIRYLYKIKAKKLFPDKFNIKDFSRNVYKYATYEELVTFFKNTNKVEIKAKCKKIALTKFSEIYKSSDFPARQ